jgi:hypothetical protein
VHVMVFPPEGAPPAESMKVATQCPRSTTSCAGEEGSVVPSHMFCQECARGSSLEADRLR